MAKISVMLPAESIVKMHGLPLILNDPVRVTVSVSDWDLIKTNEQARYASERQLGGLPSWRKAHSDEIDAAVPIIAYDDHALNRASTLILMTCLGMVFGVVLTLIVVAIVSR